MSDHASCIFQTRPDWDLENYVAKQYMPHKNSSMFKLTCKTHFPRL
jgi:hypothetical protein